MNTREIIDTYNRMKSTINEMDNTLPRLDILRHKMEKLRAETTNSSVKTTCMFVVGLAGLFVGSLVLPFNPEAAIVIGGVLMVVGGIAGYKSAPGIYAHTPMYAEKNNEFEKNRCEYNSLVEKYNADIEKFESAFSFIPDQYLNTDCVKLICGYLMTGRASDLKEAYNLLEEEKHRMRLESQNQQILQNQQYQNILLETLPMDYLSNWDRIKRR